MKHIIKLTVCVLLVLATLGNTVVLAAGSAWIPEPAVRTGSVSLLAEGKAMEAKFPGVSKETDAILTEIYNGLAAHSDTIPLSEFKIVYNKENETTGQYLAEVLNTSPELFYVESSYSLNLAGGYVYALRPRYRADADTVKGQVKEYNQLLDALYARCSDSWTDLEKVIFFHDLLVNEYEYDTRTSESEIIYDAYHFMKEKKGVCQAYTMLYSALMRKGGVECSYAEMTDHIWNLVRVDGEWYHVDCTQDDVLIRQGGKNIDRLGLVSHDLLLLSDAAISDPALGDLAHTGFRNGGGIRCTSDRFGSMSLRTATTPIVELKGKWYALQPQTGNIECYDLHAGSFTPSVVYTMKDEWFLLGTQRFYTSKYSALTSHGDYLWFNTPTSICSFDPEKKHVSVQYTLTAAQQKKGSIFFARDEHDMGRILYTINPELDYIYDNRDYFYYPGVREPDKKKSLQLYRGEVLLGSFDTMEEVCAHLGDPEAEYSVLLIPQSDSVTGREISLGAFTLPAGQAKKLTFAPFSLSGPVPKLVLKGDWEIGVDLTFDGLTLAGTGGTSLVFDGKYLNMRNMEALTGLAVTASPDSSFTLQSDGALELTAPVTAGTLVPNAPLILSADVKADILSLSADASFTFNSGSLKVNKVAGAYTLTAITSAERTSPGSFVITDVCEAGVLLNIFRDYGEQILLTAPEVDPVDVALLYTYAEGKSANLSVLLAQKEDGGIWRADDCAALYDPATGALISFVTVDTPTYYLPTELTVIDAGAFTRISSPLRLFLHDGLKQIAPDAIGGNVTVFALEGGGAAKLLEAASIPYCTFRAIEQNGWQFLMLEEAKPCSICMQAPEKASVIVPAALLASSGVSYPIVSFELYKPISGNVFSELTVGSEAEDSLKDFLAEDAVFYPKGKWFSFNDMSTGERIPIPQNASPAGYIKTPTRSVPGYTVTFDGWDLNGDGKADQLPAKMTYDLSGIPVFTLTETEQETGEYKIDGDLIHCIPRRTKISDFKSKLTNAVSLTVLSSSGAAASDSDFIATGMTVSFSTVAGTKFTYSVVVTGDINGDGDVTLTDFVQFKSVLLGKATLSSVQSTASDLNGDGSGTLTDFISMKSFLLGKGAVNPV